MVNWNRMFNNRIYGLAASNSPELDKYFGEAMLILLGIALIVGLFVYIHRCNSRESDAIAEEIEADCRAKKHSGD